MELISAPFNAVCISELCVQGKVVIEAKKEEKLEIPDEVTIENKHVTAGPTYSDL